MYWKYVFIMIAVGIEATTFAYYETYVIGGIDQTLRLIGMVVMFLTMPAGLAIGLGVELLQEKSYSRR